MTYSPNLALIYNAKLLGIIVFLVQACTPIFISLSTKLNNLSLKNAISQMTNMSVHNNHHVCYIIC